MKKTINIFGSTGIIGSKTLKIINEYFPNIKINLLTANHNYKKLSKQIYYYKPRYIYSGITIKRNRTILADDQGISVFQLVYEVRKLGHRKTFLDARTAGEVVGHQHQGVRVSLCKGDDIRRGVVVRTIDEVRNAHLKQDGIGVCCPLLNLSARPRVPAVEKAKTTRVDELVSMWVCHWSMADRESLKPPFGS